MLATAAALFAIAVFVYVGNPRSTDLPVAIQSVGPEPGSNVLSQTDVTVDLAVGYTAELEINGIKIPEEELFRVQALNSLRYEPQEGKVVAPVAPRSELCPRVLLADCPGSQRQHVVHLVFRRQLICWATGPIRDALMWTCRAPALVREAPTAVCW